MRQEEQPKLRRCRLCGDTFYRYRDGTDGTYCLRQPENPYCLHEAEEVDDETLDTLAVAPGAD